MARKQRVGFAAADAAQKTVVVRVERTVRSRYTKRPSAAASATWRTMKVTTAATAIAC